MTVRQISHQSLENLIKYMYVHSNITAHRLTDTPAVVGEPHDIDSNVTSAHRLTDTGAVVRELGGVDLLVFLDSPVHLLSLHLLLACAEWRLALDHLVDDAAQAPPVRAERVPLVFHHFRGCNTVTTISLCAANTLLRAITYSEHLLQ